MNLEVKESRRDFLASIVVGVAAQVVAVGGTLDYRVNTKPQEEAAYQSLSTMFKGIKPITGEDQLTFLERARPDLYQRKSRDLLGFFTGCALAYTSWALYTAPHLRNLYARLYNS